MLTASRHDPASAAGDLWQPWEGSCNSEGWPLGCSVGAGDCLCRVEDGSRGEYDDEEKESEMEEEEEEKPQGRLSPFVWSRGRTEGEEMENNLICL